MEGRGKQTVTRCYEYYCLFEKKPEKCRLAVRGQRYVKAYLRFMKEKGVKFDGQPYDKGLFYANFEKWGSEHFVTQRKVLVVHAQNQIEDKGSSKLDKCICCGEDDLRTLVDHHLLPKSVGGQNWPTIKVCQKCHSTLHELLKPYIDAIEPYLIDKGEK